MSKFCAICTSESGPFTPQPLGRNGALVLVCGPCNTESTSSGRYSFSDGANARRTDRWHSDSSRRVPQKAGGR